MATVLVSHFSYHDVNKLLCEWPSVTSGRIVIQMGNKATCRPWYEFSIPHTVASLIKTAHCFRVESGSCCCLNTMLISPLLYASTSTFSLFFQLKEC